MGGFSPQGAGGGATADQIWSYATRTLTQAKFPFWSAIITMSRYSTGVNPGTVYSFTIQPPAGETWIISLSSFLDTAYSGSYIKLLGYVAGSGYDIAKVHSGGSYGDVKPHLELLHLITNENYIAINVYSADTASQTFAYGYTGFKLSQPLWSPKRLSDPPAQPWKKPTTLSLPSPLAPLQKYAAEILGLDPAKPNEYALGIILEEDTPLAVDEKTGFPVERLTAVVKADVLADFIAKFKAKTADPVATGYARYIKKWLVEGIDLGVRV